MTLCIRSFWSVYVGSFLFCKAHIQIYIKNSYINPRPTKSKKIYITIMKGCI
uniref:Uncharacterized protein n=1 Tax=Primula red phytoplasma TaxID=1532528 RepID=A0A096XTL1_9MOLU|nr:hypothetical protein [Primula red phytoplasma]